MPPHSPNLSFRFILVISLFYLGRSVLLRVSWSDVILLTLFELGSFRLHSNSLLLHHSFYLRHYDLCPSYRHVLFSIHFSIQYYDKITGSDAPQILLLIAQLAYYPNAIFFSHYAYRHFKQWSINNVGNGGREY